MNNLIAWSLHLLLAYVLPVAAVLIIADETRRHWLRRQAHRRRPVRGFDVVPFDNT
jgi:hypothetical protein